METDKNTAGLILDESERIEHKCNICEKSYSLKSSFTSHRKFVHDEKTLNCEKCEMTFRFSCKLIRHEIDIHETRAIDCELCEKTFFSAEYLS